MPAGAQGPDQRLRRGRRFSDRYDGPGERKNRHIYWHAVCTIGVKKSVFFSESSLCSDGGGRGGGIKHKSVSFFCLLLCVIFICILFIYPRIIGNSLRIRVLCVFDSGELTILETPPE